MFAKPSRYASLRVQNSALARLDLLYLQIKRQEYAGLTSPALADLDTETSTPG